MVGVILTCEPVCPHPLWCAPGRRVTDKYLIFQGEAAVSLETSHVRIVPPALAADGTPLARPQDLADETIKLVRHWLTEGAKVPVDASAAQLAGVLKDPNGLDFTVGFVVGVIRPEDL